MVPLVSRVSTVSLVSIVPRTLSGQASFRRFDETSSEVKVFDFLLSWLPSSSCSWCRFAIIPKWGSAHRIVRARAELAQKAAREASPQRGRKRHESTGVPRSCQPCSVAGSRAQMKCLRRPAAAPSRLYDSNCSELQIVQTRFAVPIWVFSTPSFSRMCVASNGRSS
jgi:hypothetical protein